MKWNSRKKAATSARLDVSPADMTSLQQITARHRVELLIWGVVFGMPVSFAWVPYGPPVMLIFLYVMADASENCIRRSLQSTLLKLSHLNYFPHLSNIRELVKPTQSTTVDLEISLADAFDKALMALAEMPDCTITSFDMVEGRISVVRQFASYKDEIVVELTDNGLALTNIVVTSTRKHAFGIFGSDAVGGSAVNVAKIRAKLLDENTPADSDLSQLFQRGPMRWVGPTQRQIVLLAAIALWSVLIPVTVSNDSEINFWKSFYKKDAAQALSIANKVRAVDEQRGNYFAALVMIDTGKFKEAMEYLDKSEKLTKDFGPLADVHAAKAIALAGLKDCDAALKQCQQASIDYRHDQTSNAYTRRARIAHSYGMVYAAQGKVDEALNSFTQAVDYDYWPAAYRERAKLLKLQTIEPATPGERDKPFGTNGEASKANDSDTASVAELDQRQATADLEFAAHLEKQNSGEMDWNVFIVVLLALGAAEAGRMISMKIAERRGNAEEPSSKNNKNNVSGPALAIQNRADGAVHTTSSILHTLDNLKRSANCVQEEPDDGAVINIRQTDDVLA